MGKCETCNLTHKIILHQEKDQLLFIFTDISMVVRLLRSDGFLFQIQLMFAYCKSKFEEGHEKNQILTTIAINVHLFANTNNKPH